MNTQKKKPLFLYIGIPMICLLLFLRLVLYFFKSDGFSGLSMLFPILLLCIVTFTLCSSAFFAAWVYQDCKKRREDPILWTAIVLIATPLIGLLIYFLRRQEPKKICPTCGHRISLKAKYCEECGKYVENKEDITTMSKPKTHHLKFIVTGTVSMVLILVCLAVFIVNAAAGNGINTDVTSDEKIWNLGTIQMNSNIYHNGIWKLDFKSASDGFIKEELFSIQAPKTQMLYADISCGTVPDDATLTLWLVQDETVQSFDVTALSKPLELPLNQFKNGQLYVRLEIHGVKDVTSKIFLQ